LNCELFFEYFEFPFFFMANEALLNLYANAKINGTVLNFGHSYIQIDSVIDG